RVLLLGEPDAQLVRALAAVPGLALYTAETAASAGQDFDLLVTSGLPLPAAETSVLSFAEPGSDALTAPLTTHWQPDHPLSAGVNWEAVEVEEAARLPLLPGAEELFSGNGLPLVQVRTTEGGRQVVVAFGPEQSNWTELRGFPAFLGNVLDWVLPSLSEPNRQPCEAGRDCGLSGASLGADTRLLGEDGTTITAVRAGPTVLDFVTPLEAGVYWPENAGGDRQSEPLAVNPAPVPAAAAGEPDAQTVTDGPAAARELWKPLLVVLLLLLLAEGTLAFRQLQGRQGRRLPAAARRRRLTGAGLRLLSIALGILALLEPVLPLPSEREQVAVLVGGSAAEDTKRDTMLDEARSTADRLRAGQSLRLLSYGPGGNSGIGLRDGLNLALAGFNPELPGRVIVASDGQQDGSEVRTVLPRLEQRATSVDFLPLAGRPDEEVFVERLLVPGQVHAGDRFVLHATVTSTAETEAVLRFYRDGELLQELEQDLREGRNLVELVSEEDEPGEILYEVEVEAPSDTFPENNRQGTFVDVLDPAEVLVIARQSEWGEVLGDALRLQGLDVTVTLPNRAPYYLDGWLDYRQVVLLDVPSIDLTVRQQELLEEAVAEHGRGLLIMGGPNSYGPGGYFETVLERVAPVSSRIPREAPNVALAFVLDRSGSMQQLVEGETNRLDIARQATLTAASLLHEESRVTIVVFDSEASMLVPLQDELDMDEIEDALARLTPGGGTAIYPGLEMAYEE
ncbi:MAG TPA: VWA domain-containing protein, partial [Deinococcales bacterium]|nr:VWA domain-containing protein [Deinococcales bacterium]